jgi:hypothetical protein
VLLYRGISLSLPLVLGLAGLACRRRQDRREAFRAAGVMRSSTLYYSSSLVDKPAISHPVR